MIKIGDIYENNSIKIEILSKVLGDPELLFYAREIGNYTSKEVAPIWTIENYIKNRKLKKRVSEWD